MAKVISIELDTSLEHEDVELEDFLSRLESIYGVSTEVVKAVGPAGGAPVVRYTGETPQIEQMVYHEWTGPGLTETERVVEVAFLVHGEE